MWGRLRAALLWRIHSRPQQRGAVAVEFALVLPIVVMILLGSITAGVSYSNGIGLTNAVREGSRFGASTVSSSTWAGDVVTRTRQLQFDDPSNASAVCAQLLKAPSTVVWEKCDGDATIKAQLLASPPALPPSEAGKCAVRVWAGRPYKITLGLLPDLTGVMFRKSVARFEASTC